MLRNIDVKLKNIPALSVWPVPVLAALAVRHQVPVLVPILGPVLVARAVRPQVPVPVARVVRPQVPVCFPAPPFGWSVPA